jgi:transposase-like protein
MADREPDPKRQPESCKAFGDMYYRRCQNMKEAGGGFSGERYRCEVCGAGYYLNYEDMK